MMTRWSESMSTPVEETPKSAHRRSMRVPLLAAAAVLVSAGPAAAHAFGQRYDLPVPLGLFLIGAAAAVAVSFVVIAIFLGDITWSRRYPRLDLLRFAPARLAARPPVVFALKLVSAMLLVVVVVAGLFGNQLPIRNFAPALVWIVWWVGMAYVSAFVGNLWMLINPWRTIFAWAEALYRLSGPGRRLSLGLPYPKALGVWPAVLLLLAFGWLELVFPEPAVPANTAWMALAYSAITWTGMFLFGRERWLRRGEAFALFFGLLSRFAPLEIRVTRPEVCEACDLDCRNGAGQCVNCADCFARAAPSDREWALRPYAVGLLGDRLISISMVAFVLLALSTVLFDGFLVSPTWKGLEAFLVGSLPVSGKAAGMAAKTAGLIGFWGVFLGAYVAACGAMGVLTGWRLSLSEAVRTFALSLVPIAIAYHLAHYLSYLLIQGQYMIPLASDPFGVGWDLLGTAGYRIDITVVGAKFAWYTAVSAIVLGHIIAVYLAHVQAVTTLGERRPALLSQIPMTVLMVVYTVSSLSILAEPLVRKAPGAPVAATTATPAGIDVPADALLPAPGSGRLMEIGQGKTAKVKLSFGAMASAFHDGTRTTIADILYPYVFAYRWGSGGGQGEGRYDSAVERATALVRERLAGLKVIGVDDTSKSIRFGDLNYFRQVLLVDVYLKAAPEDLGTAAAIAPPWSNLPWHVIALMEEAVERGWAAFSEGEAARRSVAWLDIVRRDDLKGRLAAVIEDFRRDAFVPMPLQGMVGAEEARGRWRALADFHEKYRHFLVTNGPYLLKSWSAEATVLQVFRDMSYPLGVGSYDSFAIPRRATIAKVETREDGLRILAEVETIEKFMRSHEIVRLALQDTAKEFLKRQTLECRYVVVAADGKVRLAGRGRLLEDRTFAIDLKGRLGPGDYTVIVALYLNGNTMNPEIRRIPYVVSGNP